MQRHTESTSRHLAMSPTEVRAINLLGRRAAVTPTELSVRLGVTSGGVTGILDQLERAPATCAAVATPATGAKWWWS